MSAPTLDTRPFQELALQALHRYDVKSTPDIRLIAHSENLTFSVHSDDLEVPLILRVYRRGYHNREAIESELMWLRALKEETEVMVPTVVPSTDGSLSVHMRSDELPDGRYLAAFEHLSGREPSDEDLLESFQRLGYLTAQLHRHAIHWKPPARFTRHRWDLDSLLTAPRPTWGRWQDGIGMTADVLAILTKVESVLVRRLESFGFGREHFGLIHADMRPQNLLIEGARTKVIDFDDCGFSWFLYDLGAALTFVEDHPLAPELISVWLASYQTIRTLTRLEMDEIPTFCLLRRLAVVAWLASHRETTTAKTFGAGYLQRSADAAREYLRRFS
jgi:Ser/Thr protein kinase RdoA (MazF antagonist)